MSEISRITRQSQDKKPQLLEKNEKAPKEPDALKWQKKKDREERSFIDNVDGVTSYHVPGYN